MNQDKPNAAPGVKSDVRLVKDRNAAMQDACADIVRELISPDVIAKIEFEKMEGLK